ncbi:hypothetical protein LTR91_025301 [Friedmanniomyces endolithicus]|uniref:SWIRM domain-containing protein n=1 Tax=Friedmanniomyces endolithicus TaxID=329885 RepID=A0A4U0US70_9PEZI|nr:hypothetical protein LTS09_011928 [Friedmanniomyces endolithicus]KAK0270243.1 hypothetical protein LTR35_014277 [Friedmanniomyces endolithicus]KAK0272572.1 hypothetical protein LTS00_016164 [Friedmanniomyces endolithicus]KAK0306109.1 hypothetical protein LTR01_006457 [Friedmanniomyces endolithicus]KAK0308133.1 hypothetical protein LTR82_015707 [Friedmanniomyces endolithicus]
MAASEASVGKATLGAGHLHTPQDQIYDTFTQGSDKPETVKKLAQIATISPPISPDTPILASFASTSSHHAQDQVLFPDASQSDYQDPLFESQSESSASQDKGASASASASSKRSRLIDIPDPAYVRGTMIPIERSYEAAEDYYKNCMSGLENIRAAQRAAGTLPAPQRSSAQPRDPMSIQQVRMLVPRPLLTRPAGVTKPKPSPKAAALKPKATSADAAPKAVAPEKTTPTRRSRTPRQRSNNEPSTGANQADDDKKHKRAAPSKNTPTKESDLRWREIEDFSPPLSSLDGSSRLKATWGPGTAPLDISDEQDADCLGPIEMRVAATLRLKPVQYLANKRRIFAAKVTSLKDGKTFTKTAAQNQCNIDVNKASALWTAFDGAGWFERTWFEKYLLVRA